MPALHATDPRARPGSPATAGSAPAQEVALPSPRSLPHARALGRALRPLKRRAPGRELTELDEAATANAVAQSGVLHPVLRAAPEPWLRLAFVVDVSGRPELWERTADELYSLLRRTGVFRQTRRYRTDRPSDRLPGTGPADGRTMVLLMSDGLGPDWWDTGRGPLSRHRTAHGPAALVHALPLRLWPQTGLNAEPADTTAPLDRLLPPPVVALLPAALSDWARAVAGAPGNRTLRLRTGLHTVPPSWQQAVPQLSPEAHLLATHLAARDDLIIPVMQLVNSYVNGGTDLAQITELAVAGLLTPTTDGRPGTFVLDPEARNALLGVIPLSEHFACARHITEQLRTLAGRSPRFPAWLAPPTASGSAPLAWAPEPLRRALGVADPQVPAGREADSALPGTPRTRGQSAPTVPPVGPRRSSRPVPRTGVADAGGSERRPLLFFSYARQDHLASEVALNQFFHDLRDELGRLAPDIPPEELVFRDTERLRIGDNWEQQLARMLARCRTMVALYSPAYFASLYCGKEWTAFRGRVRRHEELTGDAVPALIPVLWKSLPDALPYEVLTTQYVQQGMGETYVRSGLRDLLHTDPLGAEYRQVVRVVAERILGAAGRRLTELPDFDLGAVRGYFPVTPPVRSAPTAGMVRLFVAAGRAPDTTAEIGSRTGGWYGAKPWHWAPYHPPRNPSLVVRAQQLLTAAGHTTIMDEIGPDLGERLDQAREDNQVSILLVDPWAADSERYRSALREYDDQNHPVTGVLIPTGTDDPASGPEHDALWAAVRGVFRRSWLRRSDPEQLFRVGVNSEDFDDVLTVMVTVARNKLMDDNFDWGDAGERADPGPGGAEADPAMPGPAVPARRPQIPAFLPEEADDPAETSSALLNPDGHT
ncbi:TIR-like protein FxsC [Kitasatospora sp. NBC_00458]|uniref:TIR-like protein FxsC n=1 Tax=Kitasatospora sp. NBC_00458 TaxID=2903568 RepID=UPI002E17CB9C